MDEPPPQNDDGRTMTTQAEWAWKRLPDDSEFGSSSAVLCDERGRIRAQVWDNGTWHTFDDCGVGGENDSVVTVMEARRQASASLIAQGWAMLVDRNGTAPTNDADFWASVADGTSHDPRCGEDHDGTPWQCLRCQVEALKAGWDSAEADVHLLKRAISPSRAGDRPWKGMPDITYFVGVALRMREREGKVRPT